MSKLRKMLAFVLVGVLTIFALGGCGTKVQEEENATRTIVDIMGDEVEIPAEVDEIVNLFSFGCQIMIGLDLGEYLVGISEDTIETAWLEEIYPEIKDIPTYSDEVDAEALLALDADIVFCADPEQARALREKGVTAITFMYLTMEDFEYNINLLGEILGGEAEKKCKLYNEYLDEKVVEVENALKDVVVEKETMHYINGNSDKGFYKTGGGGSTTDACAEMSYVELVTASLIEFPESKVDAEALLATDPQNVIIGGRYQHVLYEDIYAAEEWKNISAIKNGHVFKIPMGISAWNRYSIETALLIPWTASVIYPEHYEFDAVKEVINFYKTFMDVEITEQQAEYMLAGLMPNGAKEIASR